MRRRILLQWLTTAALTAAVPALAAPPRGEGGGRNGRNGRGQRPERDDERGGAPAGGRGLDQAVQQVQRDTGGRVLSAETVNQGGRRAYRIKVLLPSGQVRVITVDSGR